jgi:hypothetical protein
VLQDHGRVGRWLGWLPLGSVDDKHGIICLRHYDGDSEFASSQLPRRLLPPCHTAVRSGWPSAAHGTTLFRAALVLAWADAGEKIFYEPHPPCISVRSLRDGRTLVSSSPGELFHTAANFAEEVLQRKMLLARMCCNFERLTELGRETCSYGDLR